MTNTVVSDTFLEKHPYIVRVPKQLPMRFSNWKAASATAYYLAKGKGTVEFKGRTVQVGIHLLAFSVFPAEENFDSGIDSTPIPE